jgi:cell division protein FtsB
MHAHERELAERANAELLRQIEESLVHSRDLIAQVNKVIAQINEVRAQMRRATARRVAVDGEIRQLVEVKLSVVSAAPSSHALPNSSAGDSK